MLHKYSSMQPLLYNDGRDNAVRSDTAVMNVLALAAIQVSEECNACVLIRAL